MTKMAESRKNEKIISSESIIQKAISIARKDSDYGLRLFASSDICQALSKAGEIERALDVVKEIGKFRFALNPEVVDGKCAFALSNISKALAETGQMERAKRMVEEVLSITKKIDNDGVRSEALLGISGALAKVGEIDKALDIAREISHEWRPSALSDISQTLTKIRQIQKAKEATKEALDIARIISSDTYRVRALSDISVALAKAGELEKAKKVIEEALDITKGIHDRTKYDTSHWFALLDVVQALAATGETMRALDIAKGISFDRARVHAFSGISEALVKDGKTKKAKEIIEDALNITKGMSVDWIRSVALSKIYAALRLIEQAQCLTSVDMEEESKKEEPKKRGFFKKLFG